MSEEIRKQDEGMEDPFAIFNTNVEEITSYEEEEQRDWSKTFLELDPEKGDQTVLVKLCINVFNPKDSLPKRYTYKLPRPNNPDSTFTFVSPSTVGKTCPVMELFWKLNSAAKNGDAVADAKKKNLSRKRYRAVAIQIINDLQTPANNGQFRILRFPEGMDLDNLIASKINPTEQERKLGAEPVNVFDPVFSPLLILRCTKGQYGRDFSKSSWAPDKNSHGNMVPEKRDDAGNIVSYKVLNESDRKSENMREYLTWLMEELKKPEVSLKENWMYQDPTEEQLEEVRKSLELIETGRITEKSDSAKSEDGTQKLNEEVKTSTTEAKPETVKATKEAAPGKTDVVEPAGSQSDDDLMKELGLQ